MKTAFLAFLFFALAGVCAACGVNMAENATHHLPDLCLFPLATSVILFACGLAVIWMKYDDDQFQKQLNKNK